jgi:ubiquinone biosynthesis protein UbiJ
MKIKSIDAIFYKYKNEELLQEGETMPEIVEKSQPSKIKQRRVGLIAQQIQEVLPEAITYNEEEDIYRLSYTEIIPLLIESIKEQQTQIEELKSRLEVLETK